MAFQLVVKKQLEFPCLTTERSSWGKVTGNFLLASSSLSFRKPQAASTASVKGASNCLYSQCKGTLQREFGIILESALAKVNLSSSMLTKRA
jgi:hypothetical protein